MSLTDNNGQWIILANRLSRGLLWDLIGAVGEKLISVSDADLCFVGTTTTDTAWWMRFSYMHMD